MKFCNKGTAQNLQDMLSQVKETAELNDLECSDLMLLVVESCFCDFLINRLTVLKSKVKNLDDPLPLSEVQDLVDRMKKSD